MPNLEPQDPELTLDWLGHRLALYQSRAGYRFGMDAVILATDLPLDLAHQPDPPLHVGEFGTAQGAVILSLAARHDHLKLTGIERQPELARLCQKNLEHNAQRGVIKSPERVTILEADLQDLRTLCASHQVDLILCNPPYYAKGARRLGQSAQKNAAFHALHGDLDLFVRQAAYWLKPRGWMKMIVPPHRLTDLMRHLELLDVRLVSLRPVYPDMGKSAYLMEVVMRRGLRQVEVEVRQPLWVREAGGALSQEMRRRVEGVAG